MKTFTKASMTYHHCKLHILTQAQLNVWGIIRGQSMFNAYMRKGGVKGWKQEGVNEHGVATKQKPSFARYDTLTRIQESNVN